MSEMAEKEAIEALAAELGGRVEWLRDKSARVAVAGEPRGYEVRARPGEAASGVSVACERLPESVELRQADGVDRLHKALFGWRRRTGHGGFDGDVFVITSMASDALDKLLARGRFAEAAWSLVTMGFRVSLTRWGVIATLSGEPGLDAARCKEAAGLLAQIAAEAEAAYEGHVARAPSKLASNVEGYAFAIYVMVGAFPLFAFMPLDWLPRAAPLAAFFVLSFALEEALSFVGRGSGRVRITLKEDGVMWAIVSVARAAPLALWATFGLNALVGGEAPREHHTQVTDVSFWGWVEVKSWRPDEQVRGRHMGKRAPRFKVGMPVVLTTRRGLFGWEYVHDEISARPEQPVR